MYNDYWGFGRSPFPGSVDAERFFESPTHEEALARLTYAVDEARRGALVIGAAGVGKSIVLEVFARRMRRPGREIAIARCPAFDGRELFFDLAQQFGLGPSQSSSEADLWRTLRDHVMANRIAGTQTIIIVDDAQLLSETAGHIRALHLLHHLDPDAAARLTVILAARPELMRNARAEVIEWVDLGVMIEPLSEPQTALYVAHHTKKAGRSEVAFSREAMTKIHELTGGVPRQINRVCDLALLAAASEEISEVTPEVVESVYQELNPDATVESLSLAV